MEIQEADRTGWRERAWTAVNAVMFLAFVFSVIVQVNDPDPLPWVLVYGLAAAACLLAHFRRGHWAVPMLVALASVAWAGSIAFRVVGRVSFVDMFGAFEMESQAVEESREMYGLLIIAVWMGVVAWRGAVRTRGEAVRGQERRPRDPSSGAGGSPGTEPEGGAREAEGGAQ